MLVFIGTYLLCSIGVNGHPLYYVLLVFFDASLLLLMFKYLSDPCCLLTLLCCVLLFLISASSSCFVRGLWDSKLVFPPCIFLYKCEGLEIPTSSITHIFKHFSTTRFKENIYLIFRIFVFKLLLFHFFVYLINFHLYSFISNMCL